MMKVGNRHNLFGFSATRDPRHEIDCVTDLSRAAPAPQRIS
jgi:hypothetical protein